VQATLDRVGGVSFARGLAKNETVRIFRRTGAGFPQAASLSRAWGDVLTTPLLPGLSLSLDRVFE
jgi:hypothetical protein